MVHLADFYAHDFVLLQKTFLSIQLVFIIIISMLAGVNFLVNYFMFAVFNYCHDGILKTWIQMFLLKYYMYLYYKFVDVDRSYIGFTV